MKKPLILLAAMAIGGTAFAQSQPTMPAPGMMPGETAPPPATPPMASPAPMAADAPMPAQPPQAPMASPSAMPMGASADASSYPVCSRAMQDKCRNRGGK